LSDDFISTHYNKNTNSSFIEAFKTHPQAVFLCFSFSFQVQY